MSNASDPIVYSVPGMCGGHATLKGHRIEVSNLVAQMYYEPVKLTPGEWIESMRADWISPSEVIEALRYCSRKQCVTDKLTCCHCTLNPEEGAEPDDDPFNGWELAETILEQLP